MAKVWDILQLFAELQVEAGPVLLFPHGWVATRKLQSSWMAKLWDILQLFAELQVEAEPCPTLPTLLGSY